VPAPTLPPAARDIPDAVPRYEPRSPYGNPPFYDVFGKRYFVLSSSADYLERGVASWYGPGFHKVRTSTGEIYDMYAMTAAHKTLPLPAYVRVTNLQNGRSVVVRVNDRGPFVGNRIIDLSYTAAAKLDMLREGTAMVEVRSVGPTSPAADAVAGVLVSAAAAATAGASAAAAGSVTSSATVSGTSPTGTAASGIAVPGAAASGTAASGIAVPGAAASGTAASGIAVPGAAAPGTAASGTSPSGTSTSGTAAPGTTPSSATAPGAAIAGVPAAGTPAAASGIPSGAPAIAPAPVTSAPAAALYVQAGAFANPANARRLAARLRDGGYGTVFIREDTIAGRTLYRVRIGPVPDVSQFDQIVAALEQAGVPDAHLALD
jgi:rare lipoprotein A